MRLSRWTASSLMLFVSLAVSGCATHDHHDHKHNTPGSGDAGACTCKADMPGCDCGHCMGKKEGCPCGAEHPKGR